MISISLASLILASTLEAASIIGNGLTFQNLEARQLNLPSINLPYGTFQARRYDKTNDLYVFKNIRFAQPPTGTLRWAKPAPPIVNATLQKGEYGPACLQDVPFSMLLGDGIVSSVLSSIGTYFDLGKFAAEADATSEDCLFLDVYVPARALKPGAEKLPVINWIYGGAYVMGSKEGRYDGTPLVKASGGNVIYVAGNYRVGSFGFLAGSTVEKEGTPNAGLWDQRAVLEWIQKYGGNFGGDINNVSLWGESAGAGSIAHHLTAFGGEKEALFKRAVIQSPAFDPTLDRKGTTEKQFQDFAKLAKCESKGLACLRSADTQTIRSAQKEYGKLVAGGKPGWGPAVDGDFVQKLPVVDMAAGKFAKGIESIINSHTADEAAMFVPSNTSSIVFNAVLEASYKASPPTMDAIRQHYASLPDDKSRIKALYGHSTFTCSNRWIAEYFPGKTYNVEYGRGLGYHGTDLLANFYTDSGFSVNTLATLNDRTFGEFAKKYQSYLVSHARTGDPNTFRSGNTPEWPRVKIGDTLTNVMNATNDGFALGTDMATQSKDCTFWKNTLMKMSDSLG